MKKDRAIMLGATKNWAFAIGTLLVGLKKHSPNIADDIIIYHDGFSDDQMNAMKKIFNNIVFVLYDEDYFFQRLSLDNSTSTDKYRRYTALSFSIYEIFDLLREYKKILWIDADMLIQGNIEYLFSIEKVMLLASGKNLNESMGCNVSELYGVDGNLAYYNSGLMLAHDKIDYTNLTEECYQLTARHFDTLLLPDQAILSLVLTKNQIEVEKKFDDTAPCYREEKHIDSAPLIHGFGTGRFWSNTIVSQTFPEWRDNYQKWLTLGGCESSEKNYYNKHIVAGFSKKDLWEHFKYTSFWNSFYERIKFFIPSTLRPRINTCLGYLLFHLEGVDGYVHYEFLYIDDKSIKVALHIEDKILSKHAHSYLEQAVLSNSKFDFNFCKPGANLSIESKVLIDDAAEALFFLFDNTHHEIYAAWNSFKNNPVLKFQSIYAHNKWGNGSGSGSLPAVTAGYRDFLNKFFKHNNITSVSDIGCGDWQFSKLIDWTGIQYTGYDVAKSVIEKNTFEFKGSNLHFIHYDGSFDKIEGSDLLVCKEVLQHLPNTIVHEFLTILPKFKFALIANTIAEKQKENRDIRMGGCRPLDLRLSPFNLDCKEVFRINRMPKAADIAVFLWKSSK